MPASDSKKRPVATLRGRETILARRSRSSKPQAEPAGPQTSALPVRGYASPPVSSKGDAATEPKPGFGHSFQRREAPRDSDTPTGSSLQAGSPAASAPLQRMVWTFDGKSWQPTSWTGVNYGKMPKDKTKPSGTTYDDVADIYTYPQAEEEEVVDESLAGKAKLEKIQPYLDLMDHLAGENDGKTSKGGHLLLEMERVWKKAFVLLNPKDKKDDEVWHAQWSINGNKKAGGSTMFPASWTKKELEKRLMASHVISNRIYLQPGDIEIKKAGDTFYPKT